MRHDSRWILMLALLSVLCSCATVEPWQRDRLARWDMQLDPDPLTAQQRQHVFFSKEGSSGKIGAAGGGCGCN